MEKISKESKMDLFRKLSGKTDCVIRAPVVVEPKMQYYPSRVVEMWK